MNNNNNNNNNSPFQIVDEMRDGKVDRTWVVLTSNIDTINKRYKVIAPFHKCWVKEEKEYIRQHNETHKFDKKWALKLCSHMLSSYYEAKIEEYDVIRNPTMEELDFIQQIFRINGYKFNRKTNNLIKTII
jgi:hypothetical protein